MKIANDFFTFTLVQRSKTQTYKQAKLQIDKLTNKQTNLRTDKLKNIQSYIQTINLTPTDKLTNVQSNKQTNIQTDKITYNLKTPFMIFFLHLTSIFGFMNKEMTMAFLVHFLLINMKRIFN